MTQLRHIIRLHVMPALHLRHVPISYTHHMAVTADYMPWTPIPTHGCISMETQDTIDNGTRIYTTRLSALLTTDPLLPDNHPLAFLATEASGRTFLIGTSERPHPVVTHIDTRGLRTSDTTNTRLQIEWKSPLPPLLFSSNI